MAYYDNVTNRVIHFPPKPVEGRPGWVEEDCGCCNGLQWGGYEPRECDNCDGTGVVYHHFPSGVLAEWPGGPFLGRLPKSDRGVDNRPAA